MIKHECILFKDLEFGVYYKILERKYENNKAIFSDVLGRFGRAQKSLPSLVKCRTVIGGSGEVTFNAGGFCGL